MVSNEQGLPIPLEIIRKEIEIPELIAKIGLVDKDKAFEYLNRWALEKEAITPLYDELVNEYRKEKYNE